MEFCIHIGSAKAGSSFLQTLCATHRKDLAGIGIHYPAGSPRNESAMQSGTVSAGNAWTLARLISQSDAAGQRRWLERTITTGRTAGCSRVLLSSEWLLGALAGPDRLRELAQNLSAIGASSIHLLLVLRDPASQLISHYKHRAKGGTAGSIGGWALRDYNLPDRLVAIRGQLNKSNVALTVRGYRKDPGWLEKVFFTDWLGAAYEPSSRPSPVNPSLTLSELRLLRVLKAEEPGMVSEMHERLVVLPVESKRESREYKAYAQAVAASVVAGWAKEWAHWNEWLPSDEQLVIPQPCSLPQAEPAEIRLSNAQSQSIVDLMADAVRPSFIARLFWRSRLRPVLSRIRQTLPRTRADG